MLDALRSISGALFLVGGLVLLLATRDEYRRQRWMSRYGRTTGGPVAVLIVSAVAAGLLGAWLLRIF